GGAAPGPAPSIQDMGTGPGTKECIHHEPEEPARPRAPAPTDQRPADQHHGRRDGAAMVLPLGTAAQADPADTAVVDYEFTQTTGASVPDAGGSEAAVVQKAEDGQWTGTSLELTGGEPEDGNWVRLPEDLLAEANTATITMEEQSDGSKKQDYNITR